MSKIIDSATIRHIAKLSRIELEETRIPDLSRELAEILEYFTKLKELDTDNVEPLTHAVELSNVLSADHTSPSLARDRVLSNAPDHDGSFFKVPKVLGDSS